MRQICPVRRIFGKKIHEKNTCGIALPQNNRMIILRPTMKPTAKEFLSQPRKSITLIGMSGVGKSYTACKLSEFGWHNYSCDYLIGTEYLFGSSSPESQSDSKAIQKNNDKKILSPDNITNLSDFVGQLGDPARGGVGIDEFRRRQKMYYDAECAVLNDIDKGIAAARGKNFVNDSSGSLCEVEDENILKHVASRTLFVYLKVPQSEYPKILERAVKYPKPLYFPPAFFNERLSAYKNEFGVTHTEEIDPKVFLSWIFPFLFQSRLPKYQRLADMYGVTISSEALKDLKSEEEFLNIVTKALHDQNN